MSSSAEIAVVKFGSATVARESQVGIENQRLRGYALYLKELSEKFGLIMVSSGSIASGRARWYAKHKEDEPVSEQSLATLGNTAIHRDWASALDTHQMLAGHIEVTHHEIDDREEGKMLQKVLSDNLQAGIVSIVNENDALSDVEIKKMSYGGDNDGLASHIARLVGARHLLLLTDKDGVHDENNQIVEEINTESIEWARRLVWEEGIKTDRKGGMKSKIEAAYAASQAGVEAHIGRAGANLLGMIHGEVPHTRFAAQRGPVV
jgi:glutamate 5-kinase